MLACATAFVILTPHDENLATSLQIVMSFSDDCPTAWLHLIRVHQSSNSPAALANVPSVASTAQIPVAELFTCARVMAAACNPTALNFTEHVTLVERVRDPADLSLKTAPVSSSRALS